MKPVVVGPETKLPDLLNMFQSGLCQLALVTSQQSDVQVVQDCWRADAPLPPTALSHIVTMDVSLCSVPACAADVPVRANTSCMSSADALLVRNPATIFAGSDRNDPEGNHRGRNGQPHSSRSHAREGTRPQAASPVAATAHDHRQGGGARHGGLPLGVHAGVLSSFRAGIFAAGAFAATVGAAEYFAGGGLSKHYRQRLRIGATRAATADSPELRCGQRQTQRRCQRCRSNQEKQEHHRQGVHPGGRERRRTGQCGGAAQRDLVRGHAA